MEEMLRVGVISSTHGIKGEVKVFPTTDDPARFTDLKEVTLDTKKGLEPLKIQTVRFFKNMVILKFEGYDDINAIERYKGMDLLIRRDQAVELGEGEHFIADLIGLMVITDEGQTLGRLKDVLQTGANDVYVISLEDGRELLLPAIKECVLDISFEKNVIKIHILEGLLDG